MESNARIAVRRTARGSLLALAIAGVLETIRQDREGRLVDA